MENNSDGPRHEDQSYGLLGNAVFVVYEVYGEREAEDELNEPADFWPASEILVRVLFVNRGEGRVEHEARHAGVVRGAIFWHRENCNREN